MTLPGSAPSDVAGARAAWDAALGALGIDPAAGAGLRSALEGRHGEKHRAYHNLAHVAALVRLAEDHRDLLTNPAEVGLAIWYHDAIYLPRRADNESASAELARAELLALGVRAASVTLVSGLILATRDHVAPPGLLDAATFLDLDLSILGSPPEVYAAYRAAIRREYRWVPAPIYRTKRREVLQRFLDRPRIYLTEWFFERLEENARSNLRGELER